MLFRSFYFIYFVIQQVLISHPFYAHQCLHVNPNLPIHPTATPHPCHIPPLVSICFFSTSVSQFLLCKPVQLYHFLFFFFFFHTHCILFLQEINRLTSSIVNGCHNKSNNDCNYQTRNTLILCHNIDIQSSNPPL